MSNKKLYQETFDQICLSEECLRKVQNMNCNSNKIKRKFKLTPATSVVAFTIAFVMIFGLSNGLAYATTGSTLVKRVAVYVNGKKQDANKKPKETMTKKYVDKYGNEHYEFIIKNEQSGSTKTKGKIDVNTDELKKNNMSLTFDYDTSNGLALALTEIISGRVKIKNGKTYLIVGDNLKKIDITSSIKNGSSTGEFSLNGQNYEYSVFPPKDSKKSDYAISIQKKE